MVVVETGFDVGEVGTWTVSETDWFACHVASRVGGNEALNDDWGQQPLEPKPKPKPPRRRPPYDLAIEHLDHGRWWWRQQEERRLSRRRWLALVLEDLEDDDGGDGRLCRRPVCLVP